MPIERAIQRAIAYLAGRQHRDGHWQDFALPVGCSDAWVTAYVGHALGSGGDERGRACACAGAAWLVGHRAYPAGWGFNAHTGPAADSTAWALRLLDSAGLALAADDVAWLLARWQRDGGFATYDSDDNWGVAHPDVTPVALLALPKDVRRKLRPHPIEVILRRRSPDGTWPAYWWRACHYSTYWNSMALAELWPELVPAPLRVATTETHGVHSAFDLAHVVAIAALGAPASPLARTLAQELVALQRSDGSWPGGDDLRVTDPACACPWERAAGARYRERQGLLTTASALRALQALAEP
jgi:hypothetical protein